MAEDTNPAEQDATVTTQPSISTDEAAATDVELSPVGDEKVEVTPDPPVEPTVEVPVAPSDVTVRSAEKREIDVRLVPFNKTISTRSGAEEFAPGSVADIPNDGLLLMGLEHEASFGLGQDGQPTMTRRPHGRSVRVWEAEDGAYATFRVAKTAAGDEIMALVDDTDGPAVVRGVSVEMNPALSVSERVIRAGRRISRITRAALTGAALTYRPAYGEQATVLAIRSQEVPMAETTEVPVSGAELSNDALIARMAEAFNQPLDRLMGRLEALEERDRRDVSLPATRSEDIPDKGEWAKLVFRMLTGDVIPQEQMRALDDIITTDNLGVVPSAYLTEVIGVIDASRPFLSTTRRLALPAAGMDIKVPKINQRPEVGIQATEKSEVASQKTLIGTETFDAVSIAGAADISIQILKRSSPEFLSLFVELLAEQYAIVSEDVALDSLANAMGGWAEGNALNPANLNLGAAFINSFDAIRRPPDTIWLSTQAVGEFIDAKATTTNQPLYPSLQASATAAGGISGLISGLRAVHVPTLDDHGAFAIVGPSTGFAWTEAGTFTLQVDVPSKAGRDVGIVGLLFPIPWYPDAFSLYNVAS